MTFGIIYVLGFLGFHFASTPKETENFIGRTAHEFMVARVSLTSPDDEVSYGAWNLERLNSGAFDTTDFTFLLPRQSITIYTGDIHRAEILEDHGEWQLVAFYYSNTRTSTSIYRAYQDRIEPVSYRVTSSVADVFLAVFMLFPAIVLAWIVTGITNWRANRRAKTTAT